MKAIVLLIVLSLHIATVKSQVSVAFTSSPDPPNIDEGDTAIFNCSSNHSAVLINWLLNKTVSASTLTSLGVIVNGGGTPVSSLITPGLVDPFNDTEVQCVAFGFGIGDFSPSSVILKVQGIPSEIDNLTCEQTDGDCIECNWGAPFSLTAIQSYVVNISDITNSEKTVALKNSTTNARYCPKQYGQYNISVAANNSAGLGAVSFEIVELIPNTKWINVHIVSSSAKQGHWNFTFTASATSFLAGDYDITAHFNETTNAAGSAKVDHQGQVSGTIRTGKLDERKWNILISLEYGTSNTLVSEPIKINTFGVCKHNVTVNGSRICVEVEFIDGSETMECLVEYKCNCDHSGGYIIITRGNPCGCTEDVSPNNYTVILYAGRFNDSNKIFAALNAIVMNNISITPITKTSFILPTSSSTLPSSTIPVDANEVSFSTGLVITVVTLVLIVIIVFVAAIITIVLFFKKKSKVNRASNENFFGNITTTRVVYLETEVSTDRPRAPPTIEEKVQYTKVKSQGDALYSSAVPITKLKDCSVAAQISIKILIILNTVILIVEDTKVLVNLSLHVMIKKKCIQPFLWLMGT